MLKDKVAKATWKQKFELHTYLIMAKHGVNKAEAQCNAYHEGHTGLDAYLAKPDEPKLPPK